ncbi:L-fucose isomerase, C-terminal domain [Cohaesibacter sp. ES.047]|uniref:fucose isomerase n=1 Tax=Cohaesibacter sp. ES.047 TaxID=1798205 RepID=UPI000BB74C91|nr:fucose isomerase [Cohaesibacter sp. ES.047]SNY90712.1 L-fucose isomerase, C-terminal domain [Cohaesibacter sp. ES.047]
MSKIAAAYLVASGDLRPSANETCWPAQEKFEQQLTAICERLGCAVTRAHPFKPEQKHGFITCQKEGLDVFANLDRKAPLIVAEAVWQYSQNILAGLIAHEGPILTVGNWSPTYPGLVGLLNLNGSLTKAGVRYSSLWSVDFEDKWFIEHMTEWLETGHIDHDMRHVHPFAGTNNEQALSIAADIAADLDQKRSIMGIFDEGCMGMYNAIIPDELLFPLGVFKERLSQSALYYATTQVSDEDAREVFDWLINSGITFHFGTDGATELVEAQVLLQCKMYIAAVRLAEDFGCESIGIQYQQGLKDLLPASDLVEGLLNNDERPPVKDLQGNVLREGKAVVHFNEVDECAGLDAMVTNRIHRALGQPVETTLHDIRWGDLDRSGTTHDYVWTFEISGAAPAAHHGGYDKSSSMRQPAVFFPSGGGTLRGVAQPGEIVWSRIFIEDGKLKMDLGRGKAISLPEAETERRWTQTDYAWPIMHGVLYGVTRDQLMARHKANHIQIVYANDTEAADLAMTTKAALAQKLGLDVSLCGTAADGGPLGL